MRIATLGLMGLLVTACGDDGHVVGDMASGGTSGATSGSTDGSSDDSSASSSTTATSGDSSASSNGTGGGSGGTPSSTSSSGGGTGGGSSSTDAGSGGASGASTSGSGGSGGTCAAGEIWCPGCYPGEGICSVGGCPASACPDCSTVDSEENCDARSDCHSVYQDPGTCGCATPGCCAEFSACAPGGTADCEGADIGCTIVEPFCENPVFVISYANACYEGCVKPEDCAGSTTTGSGGAGGAGGATSTTGAGGSGGAEVCPCNDCADGEQMCLQGDECVLATGPVGNALCRGGDGVCSYCLCTSPDTLIASADGNREIQDLRVGDLVYSVHEQSLQLVPVKRINRVPVVNHHVLRVEFESGAKFEMSASHPTADGKSLSTLGVGDEVMGERIVRITRIPYQHSHTYDILPDSDTGSYFADGVLMGSTLVGW